MSLPKRYLFARTSFDALRVSEGQDPPLQKDIPYQRVKKKELQKVVPLGLLDKFFVAFGTGNGDLSLALRHSDLLAAAGAVIVAVIFVFHLLKEHHKFAVFLISLVYIPGEAAEDGDTHKNIGKRGQDQLYQRHGKQHGKKGAGKTYTQDRHI